MSNMLDIGTDIPVSVDVYTDELVVDIDISDGAMIDIDVDPGIIAYTSNNYNDLDNKPRINGVTLTGDKSFPDLDLHTISTMELLNILT